jgi:signal transduction histidine kinase
MIADEIGEDLADSLRTCAYRFVQEALNNCVKHARATQVRVVVRQDDEGLSIFVHDDGVGFDPKNKGMGLLGLEERVEHLGGLFRIESQPGQGALLSMRVATATRQFQMESA